MFYTWFQRSDFTTDEQHFTTKDEVFSFWYSVNREKEDSSLRKLAISGNDFCPWGVGVLSQLGMSIHINRASEDENTYDITLGKRVSKRLMGLIPISQWRDEVLNDLTEGDVIVALETFLECSNEDNSF